MQTTQGTHTHGDANYIESTRKANLAYSHRYLLFPSFWKKWVKFPWSDKVCHTAGIGLRSTAARCWQSYGKSYSAWEMKEFLHTAQKEVPGWIFQLGLSTGKSDGQLRLLGGGHHKGLACTQMWGSSMSRLLWINLSSIRRAFWAEGSATLECSRVRLSTCCMVETAFSQAIWKLCGCLCSHAKRRAVKRSPDPVNWASSLGISTWIMVLVPSITEIQGGITEGMHKHGGDRWLQHELTSNSAPQSNQMSIRAQFWAADNDCLRTHAV